MKIEPAYLLLGPENGEKAAFIKQCKKEIETVSNNSYEEYRFYPFETDVLTIMDVLHNGSLFSDYKIVTVYQVETITKKNDIETILSYFQQPAPQGMLFLISDEIQIDPRLRKGVPKNQTKIFWEMFENKKQEWVTSFFSKNGKNIRPEAVHLILELVENNTLDLQRESRRLILYYQEKPQIEPDDVEAFLYHSKEENVFTLFDKIAVRDLEGALEIAEKLSLTGEVTSVQLFGGLLWQFKRLQMIHYYMLNQFSFEDACSKSKITSKRACATYKTALRYYSHKAVEYIIRLISQYDYRIRETKTEMEQILFSLFLYKCIHRT